MKYFAKLLTHQRPAGAEGQLKLMVEYIAVNGPASSGKLEVTAPLNNATDLKARIRNALATHLNVSKANIVLL